jgi:coniferyl-aldehyde dehydrogenase
MILRDDSHTLSLGRQFASARTALAAQGFPSLAQRRARLAAIERLLKTHGAAIARAIAADFGGRPDGETRLLEIFPTLEAARYARRHVATWMAPQRVPTAAYFAGAKAYVRWQPAGVVGIVVPWNYPLLLAFGPLVGALAAGNRALIKMSEFTPHATALLAHIVQTEFAADELTVVAGGIDVGKAFAALPFDHLLFTGSTEAGRNVLRAAARNLTPVTLELGGKSPAIVGLDAPIARAAARIMSGKCRNAGQTCIAPDYLLLPEGKTDAFVDAARRIVSQRYPGLPDSPDYASIIDAAHADRLANLLADATAKGATVVPLHARFTHSDPGARRFPPAIVIGVRDDMRIMHEEIFGPLLPIQTYRTLDEAIDVVNARPTPLALYYFGETAADIERVLARTTSGGACINDVMLQFAQEALPFGGRGPSGMGAYHGRAGFETFSRRKAVFEQAKFSALGLLEPPYRRRFDALLRLLRS